jgi:DNA-binding PadR family transcriptional regulator
MSLRYALLGLLATEQPATGYALLKHFERTLGYAWPAGHYQIYPELARLRDEGLIRRVGMEPRGAKPYEITKAGLEEVRRWMRQGGPDRPVRSAPALRLFFLWLLEPDEAVEYLRSEVERHKAVLAEYEEIAKEDVADVRKQRSFRVALEAGLRTTRARIEFLEGPKPATLEP